MLRRVFELKRVKGVELSRVTLAKFYRKHGVRNTPVPWHFYSRKTEEERIQEQYRWVIDMCRYQKAGKELVFIDETSVCVWDRPKRTWMYRNDPISYVLPKDRAANITILGAISTRWPGLIYSLSHSTNKEAVERLLKRVFNKKDGDPEEVVVVWDGHKSHGADIVKELIANKGAILKPLPVNSSELNPIERVWAQLKPKWRQALFEFDREKLTLKAAHDLLHYVLRHQVAPNCSNYAHGGRDIWL
jgi:transposase